VRRFLDAQVIADLEASGKALDSSLPLPRLLFKLLCFNISASAIAVLLPHSQPNSALGGWGFLKPLGKWNRSSLSLLCLCSCSQLLWPFPPLPVQEVFIGSFLRFRYLKKKLRT